VVTRTPTKEKTKHMAEYVKKRFAYHFTVISTLHHGSRFFNRACSPTENKSTPPLLYTSRNAATKSALQVRYNAIRS
jgi:hypothetical protein